MLGRIRRTFTFLNKKTLSMLYKALLDFTSTVTLMGGFLISRGNPQLPRGFKHGALEIVWLAERFIPKSNAPQSAGQSSNATKWTGRTGWSIIGQYLVT